jgi:Family of unknown function (DUF6086)
MSVMFSVNGTSVWWPASSVARLFKAQAEAAAAAFDIPSGLGELFADEVVIDLPVFEEFVVKLAEQYNTPYYVVESLTAGVFGTSYVMVERAGGRLPEIDPQRAPAWEAQHLEFSRSMPR